MKYIHDLYKISSAARYRLIGVIITSMALTSVTGCSTAEEGAANGSAFGGLLGNAIGAATGNAALGTAIGLGTGAIAGAVVGHINEEQRKRLMAISPATLQTIEYNDAVIKQNTNQAQNAPAQAPEPPKPFSVSDITAMAKAGIKPDQVIAELKDSQSQYSASDIAALSKSDPNIDPSIITYMKSTSVS